MATTTPSTVGNAADSKSSIQDRFTNRRTAVDSVREAAFELLLSSMAAPPSELPDDVNDFAVDEASSEVVSEATAIELKTEASEDEPSSDPEAIALASYQAFIPPKLDEPKPTEQRIDDGGLRTTIKRQSETRSTDRQTTSAEKKSPESPLNQTDALEKTVEVDVDTAESTFNEDDQLVAPIPTEAKSEVASSQEASGDDPGEKDSDTLRQETQLSKLNRDESVADTVELTDEVRTAGPKSTAVQNQKAEPEALDGPEGENRDADSSKEIKRTRRSERLANVRQGQDSNPGVLESVPEGESEEAKTIEAGPLELESGVQLASAENVTTASPVIVGFQDIASQTTTTATIASTNESVRVAVASTITSIESASTSKGNATEQVTSNGPPTASRDSSVSTTNPVMSSRSTLSPFQEQRIFHRFLRGFEQLDNGQGQVRLRLHPPELGSLQVTLRVESQQMVALIEVEHSSAREALSRNLHQLQSRLNDQGVELQQVEIRLVEAGQFSQGDMLGGALDSQRHGGQSRDQTRSSNYAERMKNQLETARGAETASTANRGWTRTHGQLDLKV